MKEEAFKGKTFAEFSEGLTSLKLKKNRHTKQEGASVIPQLKPVTEKTTENAKPSDFTELEKLLTQLKNQNTTLKEEVSPRINVNNNININFNSNLSIQADNTHKENLISNPAKSIPSAVERVEEGGDAKVSSEKTLEEKTIQTVKKETIIKDEKPIMQNYSEKNPVEKRIGNNIPEEVRAMKMGSIASSINPKQECINGAGVNKRDSSQIDSCSVNFNPEDIVVFPLNSDVKTLPGEPKDSLMENIFSNQRLAIINSNSKEPFASSSNKQSEKIHVDERSPFKQSKSGELEISNKELKKEKQKEMAPSVEKEGPEHAAPDMAFECEIEEIPELDDKLFDKKQITTAKEATPIKSQAEIGQKIPTGNSGLISNYSQTDKLLNNIETQAKNIYLANKRNELPESTPRVTDNIVPQKKAQEHVMQAMKAENKKDTKTENEINQLSKPEITNNFNPKIEDFDIEELQYGTNDKLNVSDCEEEKTIPKKQNPSGDNHKKEKIHQSEVTKKDENAKNIAEDVNKIFQIPSESTSNKNFDRSKFIKLGNCEKKERHYNELIQGFAEIFKEKNYLYLRRRLSFLKDEYFTSHILKENNIIDFKKKLHVNYPKLLEETLKMYDEKQEFDFIFHEVIGHDMVEVVKLLEKEKSRENEQLIGRIRDIRYFSEKYNLTKENNLKELEKAVGDFAYWREIHSDGDSFYRGFMFALIESYIFQENFHEIKKLILDMYIIHQSSEGRSAFKSKAIDFRKVLVIFYLLIDNIKKRQCQKSYDVLLKAYHLEDKSFDNALIAYMRYVIWKKIGELERQSSQEKKTVTSASANKQEYDEINISTVLCFQNEPVKVSMSAIPFLFNVSIEIFYLDGSIRTGVDGKNNIAYNSVKFTDNTMNNALPVISLGYNMSSYSRVYPRLSIEAALKILQPEISETSRETINDVFIPGEEAQCEKCGKMTRLVFLTRYSYTACMLCLKKYVNEIIDSRVSMYNKENFINREYYSRPIELKPKVYLSDYDVSMIFNTNIANLLLISVKNLCFSCDKIFNGDLREIYKLECNCQFCKECLIKYHKEATKGHDYLNKFERKYIDKIPCCCNLPFNVENSSTLLQMDGRDLKENAKNRLNRIISSYCMRCLRCVVGEGDEINVDSTRTRLYHRFKMKLNSTQNPSNLDSGSQRSPQRSQRTNPEPVEVNNVNINEVRNTNSSDVLLNVDHVLCNPCIDRLLRQESGEKERAKTNEMTVQCKICDADHLIERSEWDSMFKKSCCSECIIY